MFCQRKGTLACVILLGDTLINLHVVSSSSYAGRRCCFSYVTRLCDYLTRIKSLSNINCQGSVSQLLGFRLFGGDPIDEEKKTYFCLKMESGKISLYF